MKKKISYKDQNWKDTNLQGLKINKKSLPGPKLKKYKLTWTKTYLSLFSNKLNFKITNAYDAT